MVSDVNKPSGNFKSLLSRAATMPNKKASTMADNKLDRIIQFLVDSIFERKVVLC
jgi:hypothetical protein